MPSGNSLYWMAIVAIAATLIIGGIVAFSVRQSARQIGPRAGKD